MVVNVCDVVKVGTMAETTANWQKLYTYIKGLQTDEEIIVNFTGLVLVKPWVNIYFREIVKDKRVKVQIHDSNAIVYGISYMILMSGKEIKDKLIHTTTQRTSIVDKKAASRIERYTNLLIDVCRIMTNDDGKRVLRVDLQKKISQISSDEILMAICNSIDTVLECTASNIELIELDLTNVTILDTFYEKVAQLKNKYNKKGYKYTELDAYEEQKIIRIIKHRCYDENKYITDAERARIICNKVPYNGVVMLNLFKITRGKNNFGQYDNGKITISRMAVFKGYDNRTGKLVFVAYSDTSEDDEDEMYGSLEAREYKFAPSEIGYAHHFAGTCGFFNEPVQIHKDAYRSVRVLEDGAVHRQIVTLPEYIKIVLDNCNIEYNSAYLDKAIAQSKINMQAV